MLDRPPGRYLIYGLLDPRDNCLRYIGKTHKRREWRLRDHLDAATAGGTMPVYSWIRSLQSQELEPVVFVLARIPGTACWREAERAEIARWRAWPEDRIPYVHPPQIPKSCEVLIERVDLLNERRGG